MGSPSLVMAATVVNAHDQLIALDASTSLRQRPAANKLDSRSVATLAQEPGPNTQDVGMAIDGDTWWLMVVIDGS